MREATISWITNYIWGIAYVVLGPRESTCAEFYDLLFHTHVYKQEVNRNSTGIVSDRIRLYWESLKQMQNLMPPLMEQEGIIVRLEKCTADIEGIINSAKRKIELLNEFRARMIANVVTGKLDVRDAASALPDVDLLARFCELNKALGKADE